MAASETLLVARDVEATYHQSIVALRGVSLTVRRGEIVALLGANGAGKTTFLKALSNLLGAERGQVTAGSIIVDGEPLGRRTTADLVATASSRSWKAVAASRRCRSRRICSPAPSPAGMGRAARPPELEQVYGIFPRLKVKRFVPAGLTSGGEQQMTAIGRALMAQAAPDAARRALHGPRANDRRGHL